MLTMLPASAHVTLPAQALPSALTLAIGDGLGAVDERLQRATTALAPPLCDRLRSDGGWSAHQILEHITRANEGYLAPMQELANRLARIGAAARPWRPTLAGRLLARSLVMRLPLPAPARIDPGPHPREKVMEAAIATHQSVRALMATIAHTDWRAAQFASPYARFVRLNFGDACVVILRHSERHTGQLEQLVRSFA